MNCPHHIQWIVPVNDGLHQCLQCTEVVTKKDITPKFEELGPEVQKRWDAHEAAAKAKPPAGPPSTTAG
ncbi:MAG TPA: hypothetical protein VFF02_06585 [Anaeromyxobacteraceae bacterium]|jgi:hypothetical protein|nr:hypothetical protein [Anaeromyxobacteraceae bacterium]